MKIFNANATGRLRKETLNGRNYLVAPVTMVVPGVLNGSRGKILYTANELSKSVSLWNYVPLTYGHPKKGGRFVSARTPQNIAAYSLGFVFNARMQGALKAEAWFDVELVNNLDPQLLNSLKKRKKIELSTGLYGDEVPAEEGAIFNGSTYDFVGVNYRPDHLAILVDEKGACSISDGCGVNNSSEESEEDDLTDNELSHDELRSKLRDALQSGFTQADPGVWVYDVYDAYFVFEQSGKLYKQDYKKTETGVSLDGEPVEVVREVSLVVVSNRKEIDMAKKELIDSLVTNGCGCWTEEDRAVLEKMTEDRLTKLVSNSQKAQENELVANAVRKGIKTKDYEAKWDKKSNKLLVNSLGPDEEETTGEEGGEDTTEGGSAASKKVTANKKQQLDPEVAAALKRLKRLEDKEKGRLIDHLVANVSDEDKKAEKSQRLAKKSIEDLEELLDLVSNQDPEDEDEEGDDEEVARAPRRRSFFGSAIVSNARPSKEDRDDVLECPSIDWKKS